MDMLDDVEFEIARLELGPADILAVRVKKPITSVMATELRARLERQLNLTGRVLVLDPEMELTVVKDGAAKGGDKAAGAAAAAKPGKG
jgi:hypothetical protein